MEYDRILHGRAGPDGYRDAQFPGRGYFGFNASCRPALLADYQIGLVALKQGQVLFFTEGPPQGDNLLLFKAQPGQTLQNRVQGQHPGYQAGLLALHQGQQLGKVLAAQG